jgi:xanthine dehydrogenase accessory factor
MYDIALSVQSCLRADTAVHVAWLVEGPASDFSEAVAFTPGGGRMGSLLGGAVDQIVADALSGVGDSGGLARISVGAVEALLTGLPEGTELTIAIAPGSAFPEGFWDRVAARLPVTFAVDLEEEGFTETRLLEPSGESRVVLTEEQLTTSLSPVPRAVISGAGPMADALSDVFGLVGWRAEVFGEIVAATGVMATLSHMDAVVVMGHDVENSGRALQAAIESKAGYIGSIGAPHMQQLRQDWLSYRGVGWDERVHGPAGFPINAANPGEIAVSIVAEAISSLRSGGDSPSHLG